MPHLKMNIESYFRLTEKENDMQNNVLVIGNGYDIAHGLETQYNDFINYIKHADEDESFIKDASEQKLVYQCKKENGFLQYFLKYTNEVPGWVDLERLLATVVHYFEIFTMHYEKFINERCYILEDRRGMDSNERVIINCLFTFKGLFDKNEMISGIKMRHVSPQYYTRNFGLNKREILNMLKCQLNEIISLLQIYLKHHLEEKRSGLVRIPQIEEINPSYVVSFNYTDTYKIYGIDPENVFHVHGSLEKNNMVLGFNDDNEENLDFIYFKKYFQRIQKLTGYIDSNKMTYRNIRGDLVHPYIYFYGHSMDKTDEDVIKKLRKIARGFVIYTYDQNDYEQKVINLIDVFGKEDAMDMIERKFIQFLPCES